MSTVETQEDVVSVSFPLINNDDGNFIKQDPCVEALLPPVLVVSNTVEEDDDDELLFEPDSPDGSRPSSGPGTPPTPEKRKFVWPSSQTVGEVDHEGQDGGAREPEPTTEALSFDAFVLSEDVVAVETTLLPPSSTMTTSPQSSTMSFCAEDGDHDERVSSVDSSSSTASDGTTVSSSSMGLSVPLVTLKLNAKLQAVKDKTQKTATQPREVISRFQMKGGLVGWLHGESSDVKPDDDVVDAAPMPTQRASIAGDGKGPTTRPRGSSLFGSLYDKMKQKQEQLELKLKALDEPEKATQPTSYDTSAPRPQPRARLLLQPSVSRKIDGVEIDADDRIGFDNFVDPVANTQSVMRRDSRLRSASSGEVYQNKDAKSVRSRLRSLSFATRPSKSLGETTTTISSASTSTSTSALQWDAFSMDDCLADPKLAAEFVNVVLPGEEWLLTLLYSIEEYEMLTSTPSAVATDDVAAPLESQVMMALTIIDRFLVTTTRPVPCELQALGKEVRATVVQYQRPSEPPATEGGGASDVVAAAIAAQATSLPMTLFDTVYTCVFDKLRDVFDAKFRLTREYAQLQAHRKQQQQMQLGDERALQHLVLTFDQVIESEWCCTVFWVYLFRTSHHHRLSFIMDVKFKLRRLHLTAQQAQPHSLEATRAYNQLQEEILLICRRFLTTKTAALALPTTSPMLTRLRDELCIDALVLERSAVPELTFLQSMIDKLDAMRTQTRVDFKRMSFERFASFLTSPLYRDFIVHPSSASSTRCTRADDLTQLLRVNRISFHQTAVSPLGVRDLRDLSNTADDAVFDNAVAGVFAFRCPTEAESKNFYEYRSLHASSHESDVSFASLTKTVESFLIPGNVAPPNQSSEALANQASVCFNFLAGTGDSTVYGAVWQFSTAESKCGYNGVCVLSRYPLVDGLREYLCTLASEASQAADSTLALFPGSRSTSATAEACLATAKRAVEAHYRQLLNDPSLNSEAAVLDSSLQDLFECLSITHAMRLFSLILQEKKIVMVSSSYSVLLSVGEALRAIISPLVWSHIYVPVLPLAMKGYLHCPTPFIFGLHTSYARHCELPKPSDDLAVVNLDRDSITGGGDVYMPPQRVNTLREKLTTLYKQRLRARDFISFRSTSSSNPSLRFPSRELCEAFQDELGDILRHLETFAFRFECVDRTIAVVDTSNKSRQWPADAARFYSAVLQSQAFSTYLGRKNT